MSKVVGFVIGGLEVVAGAILFFAVPGAQTLGIELVIQGSVTIATQAVVDLTAPKAPARQAAEMQLQLGEQPRSGLFGEAFTAGSLADAFNYGGQYGTDWEVLVIRLADHKCQGLTGFYVNETFVTYSANGVVGGYNGQLELYFRSDTTAQALPAIVTAHGPGWTAADKGTSGCDVVVAYKADAPDAKSPVWPGGRPRFGFVVKGKLCYDPRHDDTVDGGSGSQRWDDPATWAWSDNPEVCRYNYERGIYASDAVGDPTALLIGRGMSAAEAPPEEVAAPANLCDELVAGAPRYRVAGPVYANQTYLDVEQMFADATGGQVVTRQGSVQVEPGQAKTVVATITDADLLSGSQVGWNNGYLSEADNGWVNTVVAQYVEPTQKWQDFAAPVVRDTDDIAADKEPREASLALRLVRYQAQALRVAEIARRLGRIWGRGGVTLGPRFCRLEDGDWINWQSDRRFGGATHTFQISAYKIDGKWQNTLTLRQINSTVFSEGTFDPDLTDASPSAVPPAVGAPGAAAWSVVATLLTTGGAAVPALVVSGACDDTYASAIRFEYWRDDGATDPADVTAWTVSASVGPGATSHAITGVAPGATYYAAVSYLVDGELGPRTILGPVTVTVIRNVATSFPVFASGTRITVDEDGTFHVPDHTRRFTDGTPDIAVTGAAIASGLAAGSLREIAYDDPTGAGGAVTYQLFTDDSDARPSPTHPARYYVGFGTVPTAGSGSSDGGGASPPGGTCVVADTPVMFRDGTRAAATMAVGDMHYTRHEDRLMDIGGGWGFYPTEAVTIVDSADIWDATIGGKALRASGDHPVWTGSWVLMRDIGTKVADDVLIAERRRLAETLQGAAAWVAWYEGEYAADPGKAALPVVKATVTSAHTYVSNCILSHNKQAT